MKRNNKSLLYENIMNKVSREVKKTLNEGADMYEKTYAVYKVEVETIENIYDKEKVGRYQTYTIDVNVKAGTIEEVLDKVCDALYLPEENHWRKYMDVYDDYIHLDALQDEDGENVSMSKDKDLIDEWKRGKARLWNVRYFFTIEETRSLTEKDLEEAGII